MTCRFCWSHRVIVVTRTVQEPRVITDYRCTNCQKAWSEIVPSGPPKKRREPAQVGAPNGLNVTDGYLLSSLFQSQMHPPTVTGLYWSIRGEVACDEHAPRVDDPQWTFEGWTPIPDTSGFMKGAYFQCPHCAQDGGTIVHNGNKY